MTEGYCCDEFESCFKNGIILEDKGEMRSNSWFERQNFILQGRYDWDCFADLYIKFCPWCGKQISDNI